MSWPQNPQQPQQPEQPQDPQASQGGFGPAPAWGPNGDGHAQPTMLSQPAVPAPPGPAHGGPGMPPPPPGPAQGGAHAQPTMVSQPGVPAPPPPPGPAQGGAHAQPTMLSQPAVPPPPGPAHGGGPGMAPPPPPAPYGGPGMAPPPGAHQAHQAPQQQPQYGMPPGMQQPGMQPGGPAPRPPKKNTTLLAVVGGVVALAVIGGAGVYFLTGDDGDKKADESQGAPKNPGNEKDKQPEAPAQGDDGGASAAPGSSQPMVAGWQTQMRQEHFFQYDVPGKADKWKVFPTDTAVSYTENGKPAVVMSGTANFKEGGCASSANPDSVGEAGKGQLATVGTTGGGRDGDLKTNARNWAGNWGFFAYGGKEHKPKIEITDEKAWTRNGLEGWTATAKVTIANRPSPCVPATAIVKSIAQKMPDGTFHGWVLYADQGVPDALTTEQIDKIMGTVRPLKKS
ncbi:hypothetical protein [Streptomyces griseocarneus]|uniref:hypothetical protein n=2 Tax=Streptomyces TaxID=1883 RepID=UPI001F6133BC|nr:hypothetical protein [Streptomyces griseocarneus]